MSIEIKVTINGGLINVHHRYGLKCNPFPAVPRYGWGRFNEAIRDLDADPITSEAQIRTILYGADSKFVEMCLANFRPGRRTSFILTIQEV